MKEKIMAFGVEPNSAKYRLRLARYPALAEDVKKFVLDGDKKEKVSLLDIGVGKGRTYRYISALGVANRIAWHGIDIRRVPVEEVAGSGQWDIKLGNIEEGLPYEDASFEVVILEQILEHLKAPRAAFAEVLRVTKSGGLIVVGVPVFPGWVAHLRNLYIKRFPTLFEKSGSGHIQSFSLNSLRKLLADSSQEFVELDVRGFRVISGGPLRRLENYKFWYDFNRWLGRRIPGFCTEVQLVLVKK